MPRIPLTWLADHVELEPGATAESVAARLVSVGLEEEEIIPAQVTGPLVVGRVLDLVKEEQKNGKTINWVRVDVGDEHNEEKDNPKDPQPGEEVPSRGIICGAHNFVPGDLVVVSLPGTVLPGPFPIAARKTYGHMSDGMICSTAELGLGDGIGDETTGIIVLGKGSAEGIDAKPGDDAIALFGLGEEVVDINVTPDRGYCFSMRGVAREYGHATGGAFTDPALSGDAGKDSRPTDAAATSGPDGEPVPVQLKDDSPIRGQIGCTAYVAQKVTGIDPSAPSPRWLQQRLILAGMRPISLIVDVANYVMLDLGQPLHTFDADKLTGGITVRRARTGETLTTLDDQERTLFEEDLVIADDSGVIALAGVMGGASTEAGESTTSVLLEGASFSSISVARTARRHRLPSEASKRFERGVDPALPQIAVQKAAEMLVEFGGGTIEPPCTHVRTEEQPALAPIELPLGFAERLVGVQYSREDVVGRLEQIGCTVVTSSTPAEGGEEILTVQPPSWRPDLTIREALVEEIARLVGYDQIPSVLPKAPGGRGLTRLQRGRRAVLTALAESGLTEVLTVPFTSEQVLDDLQVPADDERRSTVRLLNPLQDDQPLMRSSILATLLPAAQLNIARGEDAVALTEAGTVFFRGSGQVPVPSAETRPTDAELAAIDAALAPQTRRLAGVLAGAVAPEGVAGKARSWDWADAFSAVKRAADAAGAQVEVVQGEIAPFHPGRTAEIRTAEGDLLGHAGELHPSVIKAFKLPAGASAFEIDLDALIESAPSVVDAVPVSTLPIAKEDFAFVVDQNVPASAVRAAMLVGLGDAAESVRLFDEYRGDQVAEGKKSLAFAVRLRPLESTLNTKQIAQLRQQAIDAVATAMGGELRA